MTSTHCDLCEAARITPWFYEDDVCWIAEREVCAVPMVVWRKHDVSPPDDVKAYLHEQLAALWRSISVSTTTSTTTCGIFRITTTPTLDLGVASSAMVSSGQSETDDGDEDDCLLL